MKSRKKSRNKVISLLIVFAMIISMIPLSIIPAIPVSAAPTDLERAAAYSLEEGNIARNALATAQFTNPYMPEDAPTRVNNGAFAAGLHGTSWNSYSGPNPVWIQLQWDSSRVIDSTRVMWAAEGASSNVRLPLSVRVQYWNGTEFVDVSNMKEPSGADVTSLGVVGEYGPSTTDCSNMRQWNAVTFDPVVTDQLRLVMTVVSSRSTGIGEWEVFGYKDPAVNDLALIPSDFLKELSDDVELPTTGANGSTITWSNSTDPVALANDGKVTRPAIGEPDAAGKITATAVNGEFTATKEFNWSVKRFVSDADSVAWDLAAIDLGTTDGRTTDFTLPVLGEWNSDIEWTSSEPDYLWEDGTVIRPPEGADVTVTLTATATYGSVTDTRDWTVTIPAFPESTGRRIDKVRMEPEGDYLEDALIEVPQGSSPSLPYRVWVEYTDGHAEWRNTKWPWQAGGGRSSTNAGGPGNGPAADGSWTPYNIEDEWRGYATGKEYTVTGWITGSGTNTLGFPITVNCEVVSVAAWEAKNIPSNTVTADQLPPGKVTLTGENRLTANSKASIARTVGYSPDTYLWNYRDTFGLTQPAGVTAPGGWENATTMLRGHGVGHYLSSMALAYGSGQATEDQMTTLRNNMKYMINTMRDIQELTFVSVPAEHPNSTQNGGSGYREASNIWPVYPADKDRMAPDWPYPLLSEITKASKDKDDDGNSDDGRYARITGQYWAESQIPTTGEVWDPTKTPDPSKTYIGAPKTGGSGSVSPAGEKFELIPSEKGNPEWFGYGYLNAIPPQHPAIGEAYRGYNNWQWAPYYGVHKQLAGLMEIYYLFQNDPDPELKAVGDKALQICKDMAHWTSDRLTKMCRNEPTRATNWYGNLNNLWFINISGEFGGANESIARAAYELEDSDPDKELLIKGSEMFKNRSYWEPLITNTEIMSYDGNSHANSRIPNFPGVLWSYRGNNDSDYYKMAKNFFSFNAGRYRYWTGNVGTGEWYKTPYQQIATIQNNGMETCCSYNLARLSKDLACFEPDNAEYMDYYERLMYNQLVGSLDQGSWTTTYQYYLGPGTGSDWRGTTPGNDCCGGTGAENHVRYTDSIYLINNGGDDAIWVNMYIPSAVTWDAAGVTLEQEGDWPGEYYKINMKQIAGKTAKPFDMKLRVPWWATKDFDIKLNGTSIAESFAPSTYVTINNVSLADEVEVICPFGTSIDYAPDKSGDNWAGVFFYGPLSVSSLSSTWSVVDVESNLSNIVQNGATNLTDTTGRPGNNRNVYSMTVADTENGAQPTTNATNMRTSWYNVGNRPTTGLMHYFKINLLNEGGDREALYAALLASKDKKAADYTTASFAALREAFKAALAMYQNEGSAQFQIEEQVSLLKAGVDQLVPEEFTFGKEDLLSRINAAKERQDNQNSWDALPDGDPDKTPQTKPWGPHGYARMLEKLAEAQNVYDNPGFTLGEINAALDALKEAMDSMRLGYMPEVEDLAPLTALIEEAKAIPSTDYSVSSFAALQEAITVAEAEEGYVVNGSSTINWLTIPDAIAALQLAIDSLGYLNPVTGVTLDRSVLSLVIGGSATLTATVSPENATNKNVVFCSSDPEVASVDATSGEVTAVGLGNAFITVSTVDGDKTAICDVTVRSKAPEEAAEDAAQAAEAAAEAAKADADKAKTDAETAETAAETAATEAEKAKTEAQNAKTEADRAETEANKALTEAGKAATEAQNAKAEAEKAAAEAAKAKTEADRAKAEADKALAEAGNSETARLAAEAAQNAAEEAQGKAQAAQNAAAEAQEKAVEAQGKAETAQGKAEAAQSAAETAKDEAAAAQLAAETAQGKAEAAATAAQTAKDGAAAAQLAAETAATAAQTAKTAAESAKDDAEAAKTAAEAARDQAVSAKNDAAAAQAAAETAKNDAVSAKDDAVTAKNEAVAAKTAAEAARVQAEAAKADAVAAKAAAEAAKAAAEAAKAEAISAKTDAQAARADALAAKAAAEAAAAAAEKAKEDAEKAKQDAEKAKADAEKAAAEAAQKKQDAEAARIAAEKAQKAAEDALKAAQAAQAAAEAKQTELNEAKQALAEANKNAKKDADALALARRKVKINSAKRTNNKIKVTLKKDAAAVGYQIQYSLKKTFKGKTVAKGKAVTKTTKNTSYTTGSLQKKTYYVRARAYTTDSKGKKVYGQWSGAKTVRVRK